MTANSPLEGLLQSLTSGEPRTLPMLAVELDISQELLMQMLDHLERLGYVRSLRTCGQGQCSGCSVRGACSQGRAWVLAEKRKTPS